MTYTPEQLREWADEILATDSDRIRVNHVAEVYRAHASALEELADSRLAAKAEAQIADNWKASAERAEAELAKLRGQDTFRAGMRAAAEICTQLPMGDPDEYGNGRDVGIDDCRCAILSEADK